MRQGDHAEAGRWLARHGLVDAEPTPLLAGRLAVRRRANVVNSLLLAGFMIGAALTHAVTLPADVTSSWLSLLVLTALVVGLLVAQWLLGWWVRRVDRQAGARLSRRVAHPVQLGRPAVLGRPHAAFTVAGYACALLLAVSVLPVPDSGLRSGAIIVLIGLVGAAAGIVMQLRQVLASPAVAEDEASLTADVVMRAAVIRGARPGGGRTAGAATVVVAELVALHSRAEVVAPEVRTVPDRADGARFLHVVAQREREPENFAFSKAVLADGALLAHEFGELEEPPALVVLQGAGERVSGEEALGFANGLLVVGVRTVVVPVTKLAERTTFAVVKELHTALAAGEAPDSALARIVAADPLHRPFVCIGSGD